MPVVVLVGDSVTQIEGRVIDRPFGGGSAHRGGLELAAARERQPVIHRLALIGGLLGKRVQIAQFLLNPLRGVGAVVPAEGLTRVVDAVSLDAELVSPGQVIVRVE